MEPHQVFKRRHYGTPESFTLITTNYIIVSLGLAICTSHHKIHWFFWVILGLLAVFNVLACGGTGRNMIRWALSPMLSAPPD